MVMRVLEKPMACRGGTAIGCSTETDTDTFPIPPMSKGMGFLGGIS